MNFRCGQAHEVYIACVASESYGKDPIERIGIGESSADQYEAECLIQRIQTCHRDACNHTTRTIQSVEYVYRYRLTFVAAECRSYSSRCKRGWRARSSEVEVQQEIIGTRRSNWKLYGVCAAR